MGARALRWAAEGGRYGVLIAYAAFSLLPLVWMVSAAFKRNEDVLTIPIQWVPPTWEPSNFTHALFDDRFSGYSLWQFFVNSIFVGVVTTVLSVVFSILVGYGFTRYAFRGRDVLQGAMLASGLLPLAALIIPLYLVIQRLGMLDNLWALILPFVLTGQSIFLARQFLVGFPRELIDAARVDGAGELQIFIRIVAPLMRPAAATIAIMTFFLVWSMFLWPLVVVSSQGNDTVPVGLSLLGLGASFDVNYNLWMAGSTIAVIPPLLIFLLFERPYLRGLDMMSGLKG
jgi:ABC-type glycerol-3-phosphate transport system permease component